MTRPTFNRRFAFTTVGLTGVVGTCIYVCGDQDTRNSLVLLGALILGGVAMYLLDQTGRVIDRYQQNREQQRHDLATAAVDRRLPHDPRSRSSRGSPGTHTGASVTEGETRS